MNRKITWAALTCFVFSVFNFITPAMAQEDLVSLVKALQKQMTVLQETVMAQKNEIDALKDQGAQIRMALSNGEATLPMSEAEFKQRLHGATGGADQWLKDLKFGGDLRMRYEASDDSGAAIRSVNRFRFRLRYGFEKKFSEEFRIGFRLASGGTNDPSSTNQTFTSAFANKTIAIDQAYAIYNPKWALIGPIREAEIGVGKVENPLTDVHSWLTWDGDITPEGIYEKVSARLLETRNLTTDVEFLGTQFIITEGGGAHGDSEFYGFSAGLRYEITGENLKHPVHFRTHANYEVSRDFANNAQNGIGAPYGQTVNTRNNYFVNGNNTGDLGVLSFYHELGWKIDPLPKFKVYFEHGQNTDAHMNKGQYRHLWVAGAKIGSAKKKGDWELGYTYGWLEANSTFSVWSDSDFGFTDRRGSAIKAGYALTDYLKLKGSAFFTNNIDTSARGDSERRLFQLDMVWKF